MKKNEAACNRRDCPPSDAITHDTKRKGTVGGWASHLAPERRILGNVPPSKELG